MATICCWPVWIRSTSRSDSSCLRGNRWQLWVRAARAPHRATATDRSCTSSSGKTAAHRSGALVGEEPQREGSRIMRKISLVLAGAFLGVGSSLLATQTHLLSGTSAVAASAETYRQLSLFGDVFEKVRTDYVEKPDEAKLIEAAVNGMLTSLDPHSSYMDSKSFRDMQVQTKGEFGGLGIEVTMEDGLIKVVSPSTTPRLQGRHPHQRHHHADRRGPGPGSHPEPGRRQDARPGELAGEAQDLPQGIQGSDRRRAQPRRHQDQAGALARRGRRCRLHPPDAVHRADL